MDFCSHFGFNKTHFGAFGSSEGTQQTPRFPEDGKTAGILGLMPNTPEFPIIPHQQFQQRACTLAGEMTLPEYSGISVA